MYKISGESVSRAFHVTAGAWQHMHRPFLVIYSDVMACRQSRFWRMSVSNRCEEVMDLGRVTLLRNQRECLPDLRTGFRTSHEIQKIECIDYDDLAKIVDTTI